MNFLVVITPLYIYHIGTICLAVMKRATSSSLADGDKTNLMILAMVKMGTLHRRNGKYLARMMWSPSRLRLLD